MSDPSEATHANPHPVSGHRTPEEIAEDEAGPIGHRDPDLAARAAPRHNSPKSGVAPKATRTSDTGRLGEDRGSK
jgi:hypothetical protein